VFSIQKKLSETKLNPIVKKNARLAGELSSEAVRHASRFIELEAFEACDADSTNGKSAIYKRFDCVLMSVVSVRYDESSEEEFHAPTTCAYRLHGNFCHWSNPSRVRSPACLD
jgi:hypothetical protein